MELNRAGESVLVCGECRFTAGVAHPVEDYRSGSGRARVGEYRGP